MGLCLYFLSVLEGEADIVDAVDGGIIHQRVPVFQFELGERFRQGLEALNEGFNVGSLGLHLILSRLVDTFISRISLTMLPVPNPHNTACVLSWEEARHWQSRSSGYSSS